MTDFTDSQLCTALGLSEDALADMRDKASQVRGMLYAHFQTFRPTLGDDNDFKVYYDVWNGMDEIERFALIQRYGMRPKDICLGIENYICDTRGYRCLDYAESKLRSRRPRVTSTARAEDLSSCRGNRR